MKFLLTLFVLIFFVSCALEKTKEVSTKTKPIDSSENQSILLDESVIKDPSFIIDKYPITGVIENLENYDFSKAQITFFAAGSEVAKEWAPKAAKKTIVIDNSQR